MTTTPLDRQVAELAEQALAVLNAARAAAAESLARTRAILAQAEALITEGQQHQQAPSIKTRRTLVTVRAVMADLGLTLRDPET